MQQLSSLRYNGRFLVIDNDIDDDIFIYVKVNFGVRYNDESGMITKSHKTFIIGPL